MTNRIPPEYAVSLQMSLMAAPEEETEPFPTEICEKARPEVWVNGTPGKAKNAWPIQIPFKKNAGTPTLKQYILRQEGRKGIQPILKEFLKIGLIKPCMSPCGLPWYLRR